MNQTQFENPVISDELAAQIDEAVSRAEAVAKPSRTASERMGVLRSRVRNCVQNFPMSAVLTAFAGGLLFGAALSRRDVQSWEERYIAKPLRDQGKAMPSMLSSGARILERIFNKRMEEVEDLARTARKLTRKINI